MENNIFENAKFGDKFQARDGAMAIFVELVHSNDFDADFVKLLDSVTLKIQYYKLDGTKINSEEKRNSDIIGLWVDPIDSGRRFYYKAPFNYDIVDVFFNRLYHDGIEYDNQSQWGKYNSMVTKGNLAVTMAINYAKRCGYYE